MGFTAVGVLVEAETEVGKSVGSRATGIDNRTGCGVGARVGFAVGGRVGSGVGVWVGVSVVGPGGKGVVSGIATIVMAGCGLRMGVRSGVALAERIGDSPSGTDAGGRVLGDAVATGVAGGLLLLFGLDGGG